MTIPKFQYIVHLLAQLFHLFRLSHLVYYYCRYYALIGLDQASGLAGGFDYMVFAPPYRCHRCSSTAIWARVALRRGKRRRRRVPWISFCSKAH